MYNDLKKQLQDGLRCEISDELFDWFIGQMEEVHLKDKDILIPYGKIDTNLYIQKSGVMRNCYFDGEVEKIYGFSLIGGPLISYISHFMGLPSVFQAVSCGESVVLRMSKQRLEELKRSSHEFTLWLLELYAMQSCATELKLTTVTGEAIDRYRWMLENRPEIVARVSSKIMASYLGITHTYLSHLKRDLWHKK